MNGKEKNQQKEKKKTEISFDFMIYIHYNITYR